MKSSFVKKTSNIHFESIVSIFDYEDGPVVLSNTSEYSEVYSTNLVIRGISSLMGSNEFDYENSDQLRGLFFLEDNRIAIGYDKLIEKEGNSTLMMVFLICDKAWLEFVGINLRSIEGLIRMKLDRYTEISQVPEHLAISLCFGIKYHFNPLDMSTESDILSYALSLGKFAM